jgi:hypothetical protein
MIDLLVQLERGGVAVVGEAGRAVRARAGHEEEALAQAGGVRGLELGLDGLHLAPLGRCAQRGQLLGPVEALGVPHVVTLEQLPPQRRHGGEVAVERRRLQLFEAGAGVIGLGGHHRREGRAGLAVLLLAQRPVPVVQLAGRRRLHPPEGILHAHGGRRGRRGFDGRRGLGLRGRRR